MWSVRFCLCSSKDLHVLENNIEFREKKQEKFVYVFALHVNTAA